MVLDCKWMGHLLWHYVSVRCIDQSRHNGRLPHWPSWSFSPEMSLYHPMQTWLKSTLWYFYNNYFLEWLYLATILAFFLSHPACYFHNMYCCGNTTPISEKEKNGYFSIDHLYYHIKNSWMTKKIKPCKFNALEWEYATTCAYCPCSTRSKWLPALWAIANVYTSHPMLSSTVL